MQLHDPATDHVEVRTAVLLAAGLGSRLAPLTDAVPKCLVAVSGVPILERLVRALDIHGFRRLIIVTGYKAETIRGYLGERFGGIAVEYVLSPCFETTNNIYSLWLARRLIDEPFLLVESDVVFDEQLLAPLLEPGRIAVSRQLPWMGGTTVTLDDGGNVNAFFPPPRAFTVTTAPTPTTSWRSTSAALRATPGVRSASASTPVWRPARRASSTSRCSRRWSPTAAWPPRP
jgi:hypothetical protein